MSKNSGKSSFIVFFTILRHPFLVYTSLLFIIFSGCSPSKLNNKINQGTISFDINYTNNSGRSFPIQLLPKTIEMKFNRNFASYTIEDRVGLFSICNILDMNKHKNHTLIKVFDKKYVYHGVTKEPPIFFPNSNPYNIEFLPDTIRIAGALCKKAYIIDNKNPKKLEILYSSDIQVYDINKNTPYEKIQGQMLQFGIQMKNLDMKLTAKKINGQEIKDQEFEIPNGYKLITKKQMEEIINTLLP